MHPYSKVLEDLYVIQPNGCWRWIGAIRGGYGLLWINNKSVSAHRYLYEKYKRPIPFRMHLDHLCRNRACVNPDHLEEVTNKQNVHRGKRCKITMKEASQIRDLYKTKLFVMREIAEFYDLSYSTVYEIVNNQIWVV